MKDITNTQFFQVETGPQIQAKDILEIVYNALVDTLCPVILHTLPAITEQEAL